MYAIVYPARAQVPGPRPGPRARAPAPAPVAEARAIVVPPNSKFPNLALNGPGAPKIGFLVCFS